MSIDVSKRYRDDHNNHSSDAQLIRPTNCIHLFAPCNVGNPHSLVSAVRVSVRYYTQPPPPTET
jgi:hypothetical protein